MDIKNDDITMKVLTFWFGSDFIHGFPVDLEKYHARWYKFQPETDKLIKEEFSELIKPALNGKLWNLTNSSLGKLALIIILDQFPRHVFRNTKKAFCGDSLARQVAHSGIKSGDDSKLSACQRIFFYGPFEHSESLGDQRLCLELFSNFMCLCPNESKKTMEYYLYWINYHYETIKTYGRFPWRNKIYGRRSTDEELEFLADAPYFGQV